MDISALQKLQIDMDEKHGFSIGYKNDKEKFELVTKELVGLFGEIGEFSNLVKKLNLKMEHINDYELDIDAAKLGLAEELADSFIYMLRLAKIIEVDLERSVLDKMDINKKRYERN